MKHYIPVVCTATALLMGVIFGCTTTPAPVAPSNTSPAVTAALAGISNNVILPTYADLAIKSAALLNAVQLFQSAQTDVNLQTARTAWRNARADYEQTYGFLVGPALYTIDPVVNMWPIDINGINTLLARDTIFTQQFIAGLVPPLRGFHVIEYLLFGAKGNKAASAFTPQEVAYIVSASQDLSVQVNALDSLWLPNGGNFVANLLQAGSSNSIYHTGRDAVLDLVNTSLIELGNVTNYMQTTAQGPNLNYDPSQYSQNGTADFANIITGISNIYFGENGNQSGNGISSLVAAKDPALDDSVRAQFAQTLGAINAMTPTFETAVSSTPQQVQNAMSAVSNLTGILTNSVYPIIAGNY
ncbi:MAG TPA: imelysin family protein [Candidatus Kapabacteria bacterium]|nr:imelysin family protein [Candidatus Kapabacteria bacterium]